MALRSIGGEMSRKQKVIMRSMLLFLTIFTLVFTGSVFAQESSKGEKLVVKFGETKAAKTSRIKANLVEILEDSRCPEDVDCIWAGRIRILVTLEGKTGKSMSVEFSSDQKPTVEFAGYSITLGEIGPDKKQGQAVQKSDYIANFTVERLPKKK